MSTVHGMKGARVLVAEDDPNLAGLLSDYLGAASFVVHWIADGREVVSIVRTEEPDLIILDPMLPNRDGLDICRELRAFTTLPIVMVTARVEEIDRLLGLELGADEYICKRSSPREFVARVREILRRVGPALKPDGAHALVIDEAQFFAAFEGKPLDLTPVEFRLLSTLASAPGTGVLARADS